MYKVVHEFSFEMKNNGAFIKFIGQLILKNKQLNEIGSLYTDDDMEKFRVILNQAMPIPEYWSLEILANLFYHRAKSVFINLTAVNLSTADALYRVVQYSADDDITIDNIVELPDMVG